MQFNIQLLLRFILYNLPFDTYFAHYEYRIHIIK